MVTIFRNRFRIWLLRKSGEDYILVKKMKVSADKESFSFKEKEFILKPKEAVIEKNNRFLFYDIDSALPIGFNKETRKEYNPKVLKSFVRTMAIKKALGSQTDKILLYALLLCIGVFAVYAGYTQYTIQQMNSKYISLLANITRGF